MKRSLHGDKDHPSIAVTLHELGMVSRPGWRSQGSKAAAGGVLANESLLAWR